MRAAVLGSPIEHSLSPALHNAGYAALGLTDWSYERHRLEAAELPGFLAGLEADWRGLSCTMPLKRAVLEIAVEVSPLATRAGAGNTLIRRTDGGWDADNTDVGGLVDALAPHWQGWGSAAVLGAGATTRSALLALEQLGATSATVYARNPERVAELAAWAARAEVALEVSPADLAAWTRGGEQAVLSTLPPAPGIEAGLKPREGLLFDAVYADWPTPLARAAAAAGLAVVGGLDLLVHQAARQFELFTGCSAPVDAMFAAGRAQLKEDAA
ncbi:MAG: shikimate dehydrogenase [Propionibacteriaceae bacterium]|nr:shikimate dehydrogenase [Propionibacteriaceae bacterium]